ncbi:protein kinase C-binding protein NELL1-like isoform X4 [Tigriopus californicus]|uniref:protein kinase C-binding protein NELL1-like isoform X4 n=1 Tax=Tigriopus californicus TaxID=6832 RepID=UPI0027DA33F2|nr:protein kinase C-binding protein NELL1-like isoform X4 [Tigriopus californicus]
MLLRFCQANAVEQDSTIKPGNHAVSDLSSLPPPTPSPLHRVDVLELLKNISLEGVSYRPGPHSSTPAVFFQGQVPPRAFLNAPETFKHVIRSVKKDFTLYTSLKQISSNVGTIFLLTASFPPPSSNGVFSQEHRILEVQSSGRRGELRMFYPAFLSPKSSSSPRGLFLNQLAVETIPLQLADNQWHKLAISVSGSQIQVFLDCQLVHQSVIFPLDFRVLSGQNLTLYVGQQDSHNFLFKGHLQNLHLVSGQNGHILQCPHTPVSCPSCGQFQSLQATVQTLQETFSQQILDLKTKLSQAENRLSQLEECDCPKSCRAPGGLVREDGASWSEGCQLCSCVRGQIVCRQPVCPKLNCSDPRPADPENEVCCPTCRENCRLSGELIAHGTSHQPTIKPCVSCSCDDGRLHCHRIEDKCPLLTCSIEEQILEEGKCCKVCKADHCSRGHDCHPSAQCVNGHFHYTCQCPYGFIGDGRSACQDIDECQIVGETPQQHHCTDPNTTCVNTPGSYRCECISGFKAQESSSGEAFTCEPINPCLNEDGDSSNSNTSNTKVECHPNASCTPSGPGQAICECLPGFVGNGTTICEPECEDACENGGLCVSPGVCECLHGFTGAQCQDDINECNLEAEHHGCRAHAECVNQIGWHYCQCLEGYTNYQNPEHGGQLECVDVDECEHGLHTCDSNSQCVNTEGSFKCVCQDESVCTDACVMGGMMYKNGSKWWSDGCQECRCEAGRIHCEAIQCHCQQGVSSSGCCPQCSQMQPCNMKIQDEFQTFKSGDTWTSDCQACECIDGQVDCWDPTLSAKSSERVQFPTSLLNETFLSQTLALTRVLAMNQGLPSCKANCHVGGNMALWRALEEMAIRNLEQAPQPNCVHNSQGIAHGFTWMDTNCTLCLCEILSSLPNHCDQLVRTIPLGLSLTNANVTTPTGFIASSSELAIQILGFLGTNHAYSLPASVLKTEAASRTAVAAASTSTAALASTSSASSILSSCPCVFDHFYHNFASLVSSLLLTLHSSPFLVLPLSSWTCHLSQ